MTYIKERNVLYAAVFVIALAVILSRSPIAQAITPTGPGLKDGAGVYLGQLLGTHYDPTAQVITYTTYLPAVDGVLQFKSGHNGGGLFMNKPDQMLFEGSGCTGTAYVYDDTTWINPWIVSRASTGETFKVSSTTLSVDILSFETSSGECSDIGSSNYSVHKLKPVTLPFDLNSVLLPYKITAM